MRRRSQGVMSHGVFVPDSRHRQSPLAFMLSPAADEARVVQQAPLPQKLTRSGIQRPPRRSATSR
jgi:hypothetical protein